ncbi:unnamed protein product, partial [Rotaria socialis]
NGTYESFANAIGQSDSACSDLTKLSTPEVDLATFLIQRACEKPTIANYLFWFVIFLLVKYEFSSSKNI